MLELTYIRGELEWIYNFAMIFTEQYYPSKLTVLQESVNLLIITLFN